MCYKVLTEIFVQIGTHQFGTVSRFLNRQNPNDWTDILTTHVA